MTRVCGLNVARRRVIAAACAVAISACTHEAPRIGGGPAAPPAPNAYWVAPPAVVETPHVTPPATTAPQQLTLARAIDIALRNNPATRLSWATARAAAEQYGASRGPLLPSASMTLSAGRSQSTTSSNGLERNTYGPSLSLSYLVLDFGGRNGTIEAARATAIAADFAHNATVQSTILETETAAFGYLAARALRDAEQATIDEAVANLDAADARHRVGLATIADVLQARTARQQEALNLESLDGALNVARGTLAVALGLPATATVELTDVSAPDSATVQSLAQSVDSIIALAVRSRPELAGARAEADRAAAQVKIARSAGLPALALTGNGGYVGSNRSTVEGRNYTLSLGLSIPLFTGFANTHSVRAADALADAAVARTEQTRQAIELQVFTSYYTFQTATERLRSAAQILASATESENVARGRYTEGVGSIVDLLFAQSALANARAQSLTTRWEWRTTLAQLAHDAGALGINGESLVPVGGVPRSGR